jgi:uncharacterized protein
VAVTGLVPLVAPGRQLIERYGPSGFRIGGVVHRGPVLVFPDRTLSWTPTTAGAITLESLAPVIEHGAIEILLVGCGRHMAEVARPLRAELRPAGIIVEAMDTGAACRTYNLLLGENRRVAAALIPPT